MDAPDPRRPGRTPGLDVAALRDLILVVDTGSITRAAAAAGVSQPAMSARMTQLEAEVGRRLLERGPRGVEATAVGLELYRGAQQVVRQVDRLAEQLGAGSREIHGSVSVGLPATVAGTLVPALLPLVAERHPGVRLELFESMSGYIQELLGRGRLDLAVLFRDDPSPRPGELAVYDEPLLLATAASVDASTEPVRVRDLRERALVAPGERSNLRALVDRAFAEHGLAPRVVADVESLTAMVRLVQGGAVSAVLTRSAAAHYAGPELALRPVVEPLLRRTVSVCVAAEFYEPRLAVLAVRDAVVDAVHALADRDAWPGITLLDSRPPD
ncbi:LysR substrate-binding domain-containing protein [Nocardioides sp. P86]|uniref:LysR substrate-binding domain-containing protein n=1 Tax=Nocardioides sp. P86 TaxID=2939569 RepID=UPI00203BC8A3|nr:LysR substrate-binding domain-containing protein [Nocardioides sp. P86]MCM3516622.1 LysR substrate-binding domain-containing protein [Nocardioides sp. P86]